MPISAPRPNRFYRFNQWLASTRPVAWIFARVLHHLDGLVLRLSGNRWTAGGLLTGLPMLTLTTKGARSGRPRSVPLVALFDGDEIVVIASNWGQGHHPAWYYNLRAHPEARVLCRGQIGSFTAREATDAERERYWQMANAEYLGYAAYRRRAGKRSLPIMVLTPKRR